MVYRSFQSMKKRCSKKNDIDEEIPKPKHKYFDAKKSEYLLALDKQGKYISCKNECIKYLNEYPNDVSMKCLLSNCLRKLGDFEASRLLFDEVMESKELVDNLEYLASTEIGLLIRENNYEQAYKVLLDNYEILMNIGFYVELIELYLLKKMGYSLPEPTESDSYQCYQIRDYSEERCIDHIRKHFTEEVDLEELVKFVKENKNYGKSYFSSLIAETVYFKYDHIGNYSTELNSNILKAVFFHGTDKLITLYTTNNSDRYDVLDITPLVSPKDLETEYKGKILKK